MLRSFGDEFDTEKFIEKLLFVDNVEKGLDDVREGKIINLHDAKRKFNKKWKE